MKKFLIGFLVGCLLMMTTPVLADSILQSIDVVMNSVQVQVNGEKLEANTILYNGSTYLPMRKVAEAVGKDVEWNSEEKIANIVEKKAGDSIEGFVIVKKDNYNTPIVAEKNGTPYYSINYTLELMQAYGNYTFDNKNGNISFILFDEGTPILENIPYELFNNSIFISADYYQNTVLPLIQK